MIGYWSDLFRSDWLNKSRDVMGRHGSRACEYVTSLLNIFAQCFVNNVQSVHMILQNMLLFLLKAREESEKRNIIAVLFPY